MGGLTALALICAMAAAVFFQPALMGPPHSRTLRTEPELEPPPLDAADSEPRRADQPVDEVIGR